MALWQTDSRWVGCLACFFFKTSNHSSKILNENNSERGKWIIFMLVFRISSKIGKIFALCAPANETAGKDQTVIWFPWHISQKKLFPLQEFLTLETNSRLAGLRITSRDVQFFQQINLPLISGFVITEVIKEVVALSMSKAKKGCRTLLFRNILEVTEQHRLIYALIRVLRCLTNAVRFYECWLACGDYMDRVHCNHEKGHISISVWLKFMLICSPSQQLELRA